mmetsp:Transcript_51026/g.119349  ORF Transcript_51026/g.119349 Transcript_51026/m.119349 type:complete len:564 (+) Transcript_51026:114-1805(+)
MTSGLLAPKKLTSSRTASSKGKKGGGQKLSRHQSARRLSNQHSTRSLHSEVLSHSASMTEILDSPASPASTRAPPMDAWGVAHTAVTPRHRIGQLEGIATNPTRPALTATVLSNHIAATQRRTRSGDHSEAQTLSRQNSEKTVNTPRVAPRPGLGMSRSLQAASRVPKEVTQRSPQLSVREDTKKEVTVAASKSFRRPQALNATQLIRHLSQDIVQQRACALATADITEASDAGSQDLIQALVDGISEELTSPRSPQAMTLAEAALERSQKLLECLRSSGLGLTEEDAVDGDAAYRLDESVEDMEELRDTKAMQTVEVPVDMLRMMSSMWEELQQQRSTSATDEKGDSAEDREEEEARYDAYCRAQPHSIAYSSASTSFGTASAGGRSLSSLASWCSTPCLSQGGSPSTKSRRPSSTNPFMLRSASSLSWNHAESLSELPVGQVLTRTRSSLGVIHNHDATGEEESLCASTASINKTAPTICSTASTIQAPVPSTAEALSRLAAKAPRYTIPGKAVQRTMAVANANANPVLLPRPMVVPRCTTVVAAPLVLKSVSVTATYGPA